MKNIKIIVGLIILLVIIGFIITYAFKNVSVSERQTIKIGVIAPLTGVVASYGEEIKKGVDDGLSSTDLKVIYADDKCEPKEAVSAFKKITDIDKVKFIIGPGCGSSQEAIVPILKDKNIITLVSAAASDKLFDESNGNFYNIQYSLEAESKFMAEKIYELGYRKAVLIAYKNAFSEAHIQSFKQHFKGGVVKEIWVIDSTKDLSTELASLKDINFDFVYAPDISFFFAQGNEKMNRYKLTQQIFSTYVVELPVARQFVNNVIYSYPGEMNGKGGAVYELSKSAADVLQTTIRQCDTNYKCAKSILDTKFNKGVMNRKIIIKKIVGDKTVIL
jgi:outer membrane PBP1 activator LpoA protein